MLNARRRILVVDDERALCATLAAILASQNYETVEAYSGEEAIQVSISFRPDCVVSDVMMGGMNGIEAAIEILEALPQCKVLFISGNADYKDFLGNARAKGFDFEVLQKPVPVPELLTRISQILPHTADQDSHCSHFHYTFPMTSKKPGSVSSEGTPTTSTYAVCLDCGKEFPCEMKEVALATGVA
jgi:CheY-like chemotaxis protein